jgi:hypothetical protein
MNDVFSCNPSSRTADFDCGDGYVCFSGLQSVGDAICVPRCDPTDPKSCPMGSCTPSGECLQRCNVEQSGSCPAGSGVLSCVRVTYSPDQVAGGFDGVCLPVSSTCSSTADCTSPIFNLCTSDTNGQQYNPNLPTSGSICVQGGCRYSGVACEPGSSCLPNVLPLAVARIPDVCTPNCFRRSRPGDMGMVDECMPGFTCVSTTFPQIGVKACIPGMVGFLCTENYGCSVGTCLPWTDVGGVMDNFQTCSPTCTSDADCLIFDNTANPGALAKFTCVNGTCRSMASVINTTYCAHEGDSCPLDPTATCRILSPVADLAVVDPCQPGAGLLGVSECVRDCGSDSDCATLSSNTYVPFVCNSGACVPSLPAVLPCETDAACAATLHCLPPPTGFVGPPYPACNIACNTSADCVANPALGSSYFCIQSRCLPKTSSGCPPPAPSKDLCLAGMMVGANCVSPAGWTCDKNTQCASGQCDQSSGRLGHCK